MMKERQAIGIAKARRKATARAKTADVIELAKTGLVALTCPPNTALSRAARLLGARHSATFALSST
ncbi:MAG TPA: hypothetical protein VNY06_08095 [Methylocella sp.]|nr:hypothetical protein [Methylocella sp.]